MCMKFIKKIPSASETLLKIFKFARIYHPYPVCCSGIVYPAG